MRPTLDVANSPVRRRCFFMYSCGPYRHLHSFPTRRSSDLSSHMPARSTIGRSFSSVIIWTTGPAVVDRWRSIRSEEHTSELQSLRHIVCRLLLEKKN